LHRAGRAAAGIRLLGFLAAAAACASASGQSIISTDVPAGTGWITPFTISGDGLSGTGYASNAHSYRWTAAGGFTDLGIRAGTYATQATSMSHDGSVIVGQTYPLAGRFRAFRWTEAGGLVDLGVLPGGDFSYGHGVSANGLVVVGQSNDGSSVYRAFRWSAGVMTALPRVAGSISDAKAWGTNSDGSVVVGQDYVGGTASGYRGFRWTSATGTQTLNPLPGHRSSKALCISANGAVIAGTSCVVGIDYPVPVIWNTSGAITALSMPANMTEAQPSAISADGSVIGLLARMNGDTRAGMWTAATGAVDLNAYLPTIGLDMTGWVLTRTYGVSADGRTIVGDGAYQNPIGTYHQGEFVLSLGCTMPPTIRINPVSANVCPGDTATFTVSAGGTGPFTYSWRAGGTPISTLGNPSAGTATLMLTAVLPADVAAGPYDCIVMNPCGDVASNTAELELAERCSLADLVGTGGGPVVCGDSTIDGADFIAFINSFAIGDATIDPLADVAGAGDDGLEPDGTIDGSDFIAFINAFAIGC
jgi:probable HAF family extracellular repeat protein